RAAAFPGRGRDTDRPTGAHVPPHVSGGAQCPMIQRLSITRQPESSMAQAPFSFPRQWQDWCSWGLGIWLLLSPWALFFDQERPAMENAVVVGTLILVAEVVELSIFRDWEEWINVVLGAWLVISPWALKIASGVATWNFLAVGALVVVLAVYEIREMS